MDYKVAKIEKTSDGIEVDLHFIEDEMVADTRKYLYDSSLTQEELESAIKKDAEGVIADRELGLANAERDQQEKEVDAKIESLKESFDLEQ